MGLKAKRSSQRKYARRASDKKHSFLSLEWMLANAKNLVALIMLGGLIGAGFGHFASAADVNQKFRSIQAQIYSVAVEGKIDSETRRRDRIQDELFRLRNGPNTKGSRAQIQRYESQLQDSNQRLRDLEKERNRKKEGQ